MTRIKILTTGQTGASRAASATSVTPAGNIAATNVQAALEELDAEKQPLDSDLTAIAALSTQSFGRSLLTQASASAARTTLGVDYTTIAADTALTSRFESEVSLIIEATCQSMMPLGVDATNSVVYGNGDGSTSTLFKTTDPDLRQWVSLYNFGATHTIQLVTVTAAGSILVHTATASAGFIYRSTDGGLTFTQVLTSANLGATRRTHCQTANGNLYIGEYTASASGTYTLNLWKSVDDGANWSAAKTWTDTGDGAGNRFRHIHFVRADPYVTNRIWIGVGDGALLATQSNIGYSDDAGANITWLSNVAGQDYRSVDLLFTADALWWGMDAPSQAQKIYRYDRTTGALTTFLDDAVGSLYYGVNDSSGLAMYATAYETGTNQTANTRLFTGQLSSSSPKWKEVFVHPAIPSAIRSEIYPFGPLADGSVVFGVRHTKSGELVQTIYRGKLISGKTWQHGPILPTRRSKLANAATGFVLAGPWPAAFGANYVSPGAVNRILFGKVRPDQDLQVRYLVYAVGGTSAGNVIASLWDCNDAGDPVNQLATSGSVAQGSINTAQQLTFDRPVFLAAGRNYWASLQFSSASATALGMDTKITIAAAQRYSDSVAFPAPNPLGATPVGTVRQLCMVLITG